MVLPWIFQKIAKIAISFKDVGENFFRPIFDPLYNKGLKNTNLMYDQFCKGKPATCELQ